MDEYLAPLCGDQKNLTRQEREKMIEAKVRKLTGYFSKKVWDFVEMSNRA